jgi:hypothetical protein
MPKYKRPKYEWVGKFMGASWTRCLAIYPRVEHDIEDADNCVLGENEQFDKLTLVVEMDKHGLTIKKQDSDGVLSDSYLCLDYAGGKLRVYAADDEETDGVSIGSWEEKWSFSPNVT